jgi:transcriptional regulator with XRE-family HTH domain
MVSKAAEKKEGARSLADVLGARVRGRRGDLDGISQAELARLVNGFGPIREGKPARTFGWTHATVSRIENGEAEPDLSELVALMFATGSRFEELLDPVVAGRGEPVDVGFNEPVSAEYARELLAKPSRVHNAGTRRREVDDV